MRDGEGSGGGSGGGGEGFGEDARGFLVEEEEVWVCVEAAVVELVVGGAGGACDLEGDAGEAGGFAGLVGWWKSAVRR